MKTKNYYFFLALPFIVFLFILNCNCLAQHAKVSNQQSDAKTATFLEELHAKIPSLQTAKFKFVTKKIDDCITISEVYDKKTGQQVMEITRDFCGFHIKPIGDYKISEETLAEVTAQEMIMVTITDSATLVKDGSIIVGSEGIVYEWYKDGEKVDNDPPFRFVDEIPEFLGGKEAMYKFLQDNFKYPQEAKGNNMNPEIFVEFIIEKDGSVSNVNVISPAPSSKSAKKSKNETIAMEMEYYCAEAVRVVSLLNNWKPGKNKGKEVRCFFSIPVRFEVK